MLISTRSLIDEMLLAKHRITNVVYLWTCYQYLVKLIGKQNLLTIIELLERPITVQ